MGSEEPHPQKTKTQRIYHIILLWKRVTRSAVWASVISSLVLTAGLIVVLGFDKNGWNCSFGEALKSGVGCSPLIGVICMIFSLIITVAVSLFTRKPSKKVLYNAFEKPIDGEIK